MKLNNKHNKGFTIVELVIVIAVIAILAAVLIPTFSKIIKKAQQSSDTQLIRNLNMALALDLAEKEEDTYNTCKEAFDAAEEAGYNVAKIVSKSGYNIAWEKTTGHFVLLDEEAGKVLYPTDVNTNEEYNIDKETEGLNYFAIRYKVSDTNYVAPKYYSLYAGIGFNCKTVTVDGVSIDCGAQTNIEVINYNNTSGQTRDVIINTNTDNVELNVNDTSSNSKIYHYGIAGYVNIIDCAPCSFYEFGEVLIAQIATGRIYLEKESNVERIHFTVTEDKFENIIVGYEEGVELPEFSRDAVTIGAKGTLVVELQEENQDSEYIWLYKQGTLSQVAIVNQEITGIEPNGDKLEGVVENAANVIIKLGVVTQPQEMRKAASEIANNYTGANKDATYAGFDDVKDAPVVNSLGEIQGGEDLNEVVSEGSKDVTTEIQKATCQHEKLPTTYESDEKEHYKLCPDCGKKLEIGEHDSDGTDGACSICEYMTGKKITKITVTDEESLAAAFEIINTELDVSNDKHHEYKIILPGGDFGGTYNSDTKKYLANVYIIKQYPNWNRSIANSNYKNNEANWKDFNNTNVTIVGSDDPNNPTIFRGILVITGHGYSNGGWEASPDLAATTIKNLNFDHSDLYGIKNGNTIDTTWKFKDGNGCFPIMGMAASQNVTITNCSFKNTGRIVLGYSQSNTLEYIISEENEVIATAGYSYNPTISNCIFDNVTCALQGYFHGASDLVISGCSGTVGNFVNDQAGGEHVNIIISDCNITFTKKGYLFRTLSSGQNINIVNSTFDRTLCDDTPGDGIFAVKTNSPENNVKIKFTSCTFTGGHYGINIVKVPSSDFSITFDKCTGITSISDLILGENITSESTFVHFINE